MSDEARQLDWDAWVKELGESPIADVVTALDDMLEVEDSIERVMKVYDITWTPEAYLAFHNVQAIVRKMRQKILAIPMRKE